MLANSLKFRQISKIDSKLIEKLTKRWISIVDSKQKRLKSYSD